MKRWWRRSAAILVLSSVTLASFLPTYVSAAAPVASSALLHIAPDTSNVTLPATGQVIVKFSQPQAALAAKSQTTMTLAAGGARVLSQRDPSRMVVKLPDAPAQAKAMITALRKLPGVAYVENDEPMKAFAAPNDHYYGLLWGHTRIHAEQAWPLVNPSAPAVVVAVVDTGVNSAHEDLIGRLLPGKNFVTPDTPPEDDHGHGSHVSGTIAATYNNGIGITGVTGPANVKILPVKVLNSTGWGTTSDIADGIKWAADQGADVINLSLGGGYTITMEEAVKYAAAKGAVVVTAAGNDAMDTANVAPAAAPGAVTVAALDRADQPASFSNYGDQVEVIAPGVEIASVYLNTAQGNYAYMDGTSMAAPHVAGVAALIKATHPTYTRAQIQACLYSTVETIPGLPSGYGAGVTRADRAVACNATTVDKKYALKLESPDPNQLVTGLTNFTFDVNPAFVSSIQVKDAGGAILGSQQVTGDLTPVPVDLRKLLAGNTKLTAVALNQTGKVVTSLTFTALIGGAAVAVKVADAGGAPVTSGNVEIYTNDAYRYGSQTYDDWTPYGYFGLDENGVLNLSNAAIPEGTEVLAIAYASDADGNPIVRYGKGISPATISLNGPLVKATFVTTGLPAPDGQYILSVDGDDLLPPAQVETRADGTATAWVQPGNYDLLYSDIDATTGAGYHLAQHVILGGAAAKVTTDLTNTATLAWTPTPDRNYDRMGLVVGKRRIGHGMYYAMPVTGGSLVVKKGNYQVGFDFSVVDTAGTYWDYYLVGRSENVPAGGSTIQEGSLAAMQMHADASVMPGQDWFAWYDYQGENGTALWGLSKETAGGAGIAGAGQPLVVKSLPGRAPVIQGDHGSTPVISGARYETVHPVLSVVNDAGEPANLPADTLATFYSNTWSVPGKITTGPYTARVTLDAGPLGSLQAEQPLTVGPDTIADGVRVLVHDAEGRPLPGASVSLLYQSLDAAGNVVYATAKEGRSETDANGYARLYAPELPENTPVKVAVTYAYTDSSGVLQVYGAVDNDDVPGDLVISLADTELITVSGLTPDPDPENAGTPQTDPAVITDGAIGAAFVDATGAVLLPVSYVDSKGYYRDTINTDPQGKVRFHLSEGTVKFTVTNWDEKNRTFTVSDPFTLTAEADIVVPAGPLAPLQLDGNMLAPDGSLMAAEFADAFPGDLPGWIPLTSGGALSLWKVTPGVYHHIGGYSRISEDLAWLYELVGSAQVDQTGSLIQVGGPLRAQIAQPDTFGTNGYYFPVLFSDARQNQLIGVDSYDPAVGGVIASVPAVKQGVSQQTADPARVNQLRDTVRMLRLKAERAGTPAVKALNAPAIMPYLVVRDPAGREVWHNKEYLNWFYAPYVASPGASGQYTAEIQLGIGPEGLLKASVPFNVAMPSLTVSPNPYNPTSKAKLTITLNLPAQDTYSIAVRDAQGALVRTIAPDSAGTGKIVKTWDGKDAAGKVVPNAPYSVVVTTGHYGTFSAKVNPTAIVPTAAVSPVVNQPFATVSGAAAPGLRVVAQTKGPGQTGFVDFPTTVTAGADGKYALTIALDRGEGSYQIKVKSLNVETNSASAWSGVMSVRLDQTNPTLTLTSHNVDPDGLLINTDRPTLQGKTEAGATVLVTVTAPENQPTELRATATAAGDWRLQNLQLRSGPNTITLRATDLAGNQSEVRTFSVTVDKQAPALAKIDDQPAIRLLLTTGDAPPVSVAPIVDKNGNLSFYANGTGVTSYQLSGLATELLGRATASPPANATAPVINGNMFTVQIKPKTTGSTVLTLTMADKAGNTANLPQMSVTLDAAPPSLTISTPANQSVATNDWEAREATVAITGRATNDLLSRVSVIDADHPDAVLDVEGSINGMNFTAVVTLPLGDTDAIYNLQVIGYDLAGNKSLPNGTSDRRTVKVDVLPPAAPVLATPVLTENKLLSKVKSIALTGTAEANAKVVAEGTGAATPPSATVDRNGNYNLPLTLNDGVYEISLFTVDAASNKSTPVPFTVTVDTTAPVVGEGALTLLVGDVAKPFVKGKSGYTVAAADAPGYKLQGSFKETITQVTVGTASAQLTSGTTFEYDLAASLPKSGTFSFPVKIYDVAGNVQSTTVAIALDKTLPTVTISEPNQFKAASATFTINGSESLSGVQVVSADGRPLDDLTISARISSTKTPNRWNVSITSTAAAPGTWSLRFRGVDLAGNLSAEAANNADVRDLALDPIAPVLDVTDLIDEVLYTTGNSVTVVASATDEGSGLQSVTIGGSTVTADPSDGLYRKTFTLKTEGLTTIEVRATDKAGGATLKKVYVVRKTKITALTASASVSRDKRTMTLSGTTDRPIALGNGSTVAYVKLRAVIVNDTTKQETIIDLQPTPSGTGTFSFGNIDISGLEKGSYTITVTATAPEEFTGATFNKKATKTFSK